MGVLNKKKEEKNASTEINLASKPMIQSMSGRCHFDWPTNTVHFNTLKIIKNT